MQWGPDSGRLNVTNNDMPHVLYVREGDKSTHTHAADGFGGPEAKVCGNATARLHPPAGFTSAARAATVAGCFVYCCCRESSQVISVDTQPLSSVLKLEIIFSAECETILSVFSFVAILAHLLLLLLLETCCCLAAKTSPEHKQPQVSLQRVVHKHSRPLITLARHSSQPLCRTMR
jgi:hypothetical protein